MVKANRRIALFLTSLAVAMTAISQRGFAQEQHPPTVVLDPGHGWNVDGRIDNGAASGDLIEKEINLNVALHTRNYLERCPIDVHLTRGSDEPSRTKQEIDEIVNSYNPTVGISIHTNSGPGNPSGTEAWYTVDGYDDIESQHLSTLIAESISSRLQIPNRGAKPENQNPRGGLYINLWDAPSTLVELAFLQGDATLLRDHRTEFGRAIAKASVEFLDMDPHCGDWAIAEGWEIDTYFPGDSRTNIVRLRNDSLLDWRTVDYFLTNVGSTYGAEAQYPLLGQMAINEVATREIPVKAPLTPGVYRQKWQLVRGTEVVGKRAIVYIIVVPEDARELRQDIDRRIEEIQQRGELEAEKFLDNLEQEALQWRTKEITQLDCMRPTIASFAIIGSVLLIRRKRTQTIR